MDVLWATRLFHGRMLPKAARPSICLKPPLDLPQLKANRE
jgi:hypothetical protein